jgi:hypothetical protein
MRDTPAALDKLYLMLNEAESLGLSRPARLRLIGIIGSLENEELDRFRRRYASNEGQGPSYPNESHGSAYPDDDAPRFGSRSRS